MNLEPIKVLILDDEYYVRDSLENFISRDPRTIVIISTGSIDEALSTISGKGPMGKPDVALVDLLFKNEHTDTADIDPILWTPRKGYTAQQGGVRWNDNSTTESSKRRQCDCASKAMCR